MKREKILAHSKTSANDLLTFLSVQTRDVIPLPNIFKPRQLGFWAIETWDYAVYWCFDLPGGLAKKVPIKFPLKSGTR